jgi:penicillin amidase
MPTTRDVWSHVLILGLAGTLFACNLATIDAPLVGQMHPSEPVDILVRLEEGADPATFQAYLNGADVTGLFVLDADLKLLTAKVGSGDGLVVGPNGLQTVIQGVAQGFPFTDHDSTGFLVGEGGVATNRDDKGVWFITGPEDASVYEIAEAMGYAVAQDRLWQMELYRLTGRGRLSEVLGASMVSTDTYLRTMGYSDQELIGFFEALDPEPKSLVQGFLDGINRRIADLENNRLHIPLEFKLINANRIINFDFAPILRKWTVVDLFGWLTVLQRNFDGEGTSQQEVRNAALYQDLAARFPDDYIGMFEDLRWLDDPDALTYVPAGGGDKLAPMTAASRSLSMAPVRPAPGALPDLRQTADRMKAVEDEVVERLKSINAYVKMGSYGWVVSGDRTASGNPILYSGPQMGFEVPSIVTEGCIRAGGLETSGMTVPGMPGLIISRTPHHAFAMMTGHVNSADHYIEDLADVSLHRTEKIQVLGESDVTLNVYRSAHGPVVSPMPFDPATYNEETDGPILSWKYAYWGHEFDSMVALLRLPRSSNMDDFEEGLEFFPASFHILYNDVDGNIAYWMTGRDPVRPEGEWRLPQGFLGDPLEWDGDVLLPRSTDRNTGQGFYCGWNNKAIPTYLTTSGHKQFGPFHRAQVLYDHLAAHDDLTFDEVRNTALRIASTDSFGGGGNPWKFVKDYFTAVVTAHPTQERVAALSVMEGWDGHFVAGGESQWAFGTDRADAWVLMDKWIREVIRLTFEDELGTGENKEVLFNVFLHGLPWADYGLPGTALTNNYDWFRNLADPLAPQTADAIILAALDNAIAALGPRPWGMDARGEINFNHPVLANIGAGLVHTMPFASRSTYAQCVEMGPGGPVRIESMFPLGESGTAHGDPIVWSLDPHFLSMTGVYDGFVHRPFPLFD